MSHTTDREVTDVPAHRYTAALAGRIERDWQDLWESQGTFDAPNPAGPWADPERVADREKLYVLDMFPYPSGAGLHVGHPLGYIATDVYGRYQRMRGKNVLHALGYDAFGLPAEQYAVQTGQHPRKTTEDNIVTMRRQLRRLGLAHDARRSVATTDPEFVRWTQWMFLRIWNAWYDTEADGGRGRARPISELEAQFADGTREVPGGRDWADLTDGERRDVVDGYRLAYVSEAPVNWCPGLGTVLSNEEVTNEGRSERGNFPVFKRNLRQWMMRISAYADRLTDDLDRLDWPEPVKLMQRNWIGRSEGAQVRFAVEGAEPIEVFTTRPDTLFGATFMVLAPEHPLVDSIVPSAWPEGTAPSWTGGHADPASAIAQYRIEASTKSDLERQTEGREKTGVFTGAYATNPVDGRLLPVFVADYVLMGYGTGAIMAVPGQDERDWEFAARFDLPVIRTVQPPEGWEGEAFTGEGPAINSANDEIDLNGLDVAEAKRTIIDWLQRKGLGQSTVTYKLRDWLFSRQRYWGEPFPVVFDDEGRVHAIPDDLLPVELPDVPDYAPRTFAPDDATSDPEPPLGRVPEWVDVELDLGDGPRRYRRETNTMPNWAGSCWYFLRYLDPANVESFCDTENEAYWMGPRGTRGDGQPDTGGVDLYVGGVEHAVLHLLYARFWHKVLHDLGYVTSEEPFRRYFGQGMIQAYAYRDARGQVVPADEVVEVADGEYTWQGEPVTREHGKMGKSLKNVVTPDEMYEAYGADTFRVYEMSMGPLDVSRPWETRAVVGSLRFLQRLWRNVVDEEAGKVTVTDDDADPASRRALHQAIDAVTRDYDSLRFNTAVAKLIELNNHLTRLPAVPRELAEPIVLMVAPLAPHLAEELWRRLGHTESLAYEPFPQADPALLVDERVTCVVQVQGKVRDRLEVAPGIGDDDLRALALASEKVAAALDGRGVRTVIVRAPKLVNVVPE
ncbi:leucine--tRNA ligase [Angustibacter sp. Root456]|uniref:leucine--tRNA ligase n=1 Tax=Angustibacter sp. Root456 TaxID=1736539 RepID=UPI0006FC26E1|nr:leucine--tRNA ligase [Angustibacter sp. Root456]KQX68865.1 leucine--tRNA ligase [Angustibacter sp. Root456]